MKKAWRGVVLVAAIATLAMTGSAQAQLTIGQLPGAKPDPLCISDPLDLAPFSIASGTSYEVPFEGVITSWSTFAGDGAGQQLTFKLVRSFESGYLVRGHDGPRPLVPGQVNTFHTSIPVQQGDLLSLNDANAAQVPNACLVETGDAADAIDFPAGGGDTPDGQVWQPSGLPDRGFRLNVSATILPPPRIAAIGPVEASVAGGTPIAVSGVNFAELQSVSFSGVPALGFSVANEGQLTAIAPPNTALTSRTIEVKTVAGRATSPQTVNYVGCVVPLLKKYKLKAAKNKLLGARCALGKVKRLRKVSIRKGKVSRQSPAPGTILAPGSKVAVTLKGGR